MSNNIRILQITKAKFPPEIRVLKEALSIADSGNISAVLCPGFEGQSEFEIWENIHVFRPNSLKNRSKIEKIFEQITFFSPAWFFAIRDVIKKFKPDVIHFHDIWLGKVVFSLVSDEKVIIDLHENMPAAVLEYRNGYSGIQKWFRLVFHNYKRIFNYERKLLEKSNLIFVVVKEAQERVLSNHPFLDINKVRVVENLESKRFIRDLDNKKKSLINKDYFLIIYIGGFGPHRGIETLINAIAVLKNQGIKDIKLNLIGAVESQYLKSLKDQVLKRQLIDFISIIGWVNSDKVLDYILESDVCCVPHNSNPHTDSTIPHKLYQYMISKKPILVSSSKPLARTIDKANSGLIFSAGDPQHCAKKILELYNDNDLCTRLSENGFSYVMNNGHNWEEESSLALIQSYNDLFR
jgi:glycosyltransferase involved in cell wall biosynthesis